MANIVSVFVVELGAKKRNHHTHQTNVRGMSLESRRHRSSKNIIINTAVLPSVSLSAHESNLEVWCAHWMEYFIVYPWRNHLFILWYAELLQLIPGRRDV